MKKLMSFGLIFILTILLVGCNNNTPSKTKSEIEVERERLDMIAEAIYRADYPVKQGQIITGDLNLPTSYKDVKITWKSINYPEIINDAGKVTRPDTCWIESRDQQGVKKFPDINQNWPVILEGTFTYEGVSDTHKLLVVVKPAEGFTCDKYLGNK